MLTLSEPRRIDLRLLVIPMILLLTGAGAGPAAAQATFARTGDTTVGRNLSTATLLTDGRVLVTGGTRTGPTTSIYNKEAELYDPKTSAFTATGSMSVPRINHTAVRLNDGRVLVLGGEADPSSSSLNTAELFDPAKGTFTATGNLAAPGREDATATLLKDGRVLVGGGYYYDAAQDTSSIVISSEIYDPSAGKFTVGPPATRDRVEHGAVALPDGRVLLVGGYGVAADGVNVVMLNSVEAYDPTARTFSVIGGLNEGHVNPSVALLPDGKVLVAGGVLFSSDGSTSTPSSTVEVFDPATGKSTTAGAMTEGRVFPVAQALTDGRVLLAGGSTGANEDHSTASADLFDPKTGKITAISPLTESRTQSASARLLDGRVLIVGGARITNGNVVLRLQTAEIYSP